MKVSNKYIKRHVSHLYEKKRKDDPLNEKVTILDYINSVISYILPADFMEQLYIQWGSEKDIFPTRRGQK